MKTGFVSSFLLVLFLGGALGQQAGEFTDLLLPVLSGVPPTTAANNLRVYCQGCIARCVTFTVRDWSECFQYCNALLPQPSTPPNPQNPYGLLCPFSTAPPAVWANHTIYPIPDPGCTDYSPVPQLDARKAQPRGRSHSRWEDDHDGHGHGDNHDNSAYDKKNIVVFLLDDQDEIVSPYFTAMPFAASLFRDNGTRFTNAYSSTAICCASRCQLLTGLYGHNVGVLTNVGLYGGLKAFKAPLTPSGTRVRDNHGRCVDYETSRTLPLLLKQSGYQTAIWGKYLNGVENDTSFGTNFPVAPGWDHFGIGTNRNYYSGYGYVLTNWNSDSGASYTNITYEPHGYTPDDFVLDVIANKSIAWILSQRQNPQNKPPLFAYLSFPGPHFPMPAAKRHQSFNNVWSAQYDEVVTTRPNFNVTQLNPNSNAAANDGIRTDALAGTWNRVDYIKRMGCLMAVDEAIQKVYQTIVNLGELDDTVFILTSDNGYNLGAHKLLHKMAPYDESVKVPLYFAGSSIRKNKEISEPALLIDLAPTILEFANLNPPSYMDGKSWWSNLMLHSESEHRRSKIVLQYRKYVQAEYNVSALTSEINPVLIPVMSAGFLLDFPPYTAIRNEDELFVQFVKADGSFEYEYYDLSTDPHQLNNKFSSLKHSRVQKFLRTLDNLGSCSGRDCLGDD